tara:strand:+ start:1128 stop:2039 length:912 start_codon:yes stop_codon:yes gene_type:complete
MKKTTMNIWDGSISHCNSWKEAGLECGIRIDDSPLIKGPENVEWIRKQHHFDGITVFTDRFFHRDTILSVDSPFKVGLLIEPIAVYKRSYRDAENAEDLLDFIFTFNKRLINKDPSKYKFIPADWCCVEDISYGGEEKTKLVSMIYSPKGSIDRSLRHDVAGRFSDSIDLFGGNRGEVALKSDTLNSHMFSVAIENSIDSFYYTEKIIDCFITKNVPIYRGAQSIGDFFDEGGIIQWDTLDELNDIIETLSPEKYSKMLPHITENYHIAKKYINPDDILYDLICKCLHNKNYDTSIDFRHSFS